MAEACAYTPGLKIKSDEIIRKIRKLPISGEVLVKEGDIVSYDTVVARTYVPGDVYLVNVALMLGIDPSEIERYMIKKVGDSLKKDETVARLSYFFGLIKRECKTPVNGTIEFVSNVTGQVGIREPSIPVEVSAYVSGKVVKVLPKEGVIIETRGAIIQGIFGIGGEKHGDLMMLANSPNETLTANEIREDYADKILIGGALVTSDALRKAVNVGVRGIIAGGINANDLKDFLGYEIGVAITGEEEVGLTLIVTEGFGKMNMSKRTFNLLKSLDGKHASINGATQIRAGVIRPEIIVPQMAELSKPREDLKEEISVGIQIGTAVRVIREPYFGAIGRVVSLPVELQRIETESLVRVVEVLLEDGRRVLVPRANVEIIEE